MQPWAQFLQRWLYCRLPFSPRKNAHSSRSRMDVFSPTLETLILPLMAGQRNITVFRKMVLFLLHGILVERNRVIGVQHLRGQVPEYAAETVKFSAMIDCGIFKREQCPFDKQINGYPLSRKGF